MIDWFTSSSERERERARASQPVFSVFSVFLRYVVKRDTGNTLAPIRRHTSYQAPLYTYHHSQCGSQPRGSHSLVPEKLSRDTINRCQVSLTIKPPEHHPHPQHPSSHKVPSNKPAPRASQPKPHTSAKAPEQSAARAGTSAACSCTSPGP